MHFICRFRICFFIFNICKSQKVLGFYVMWSWIRIFLVNTESMWQFDPKVTESYPERPGLPDCVYYMRTGTCGYGSRCRYNHPRNRAAVNIISLRLTSSLPIYCIRIYFCVVGICYDVQFFSLIDRWLLCSEKYVRFWCGKSDDFLV